MRIDGERVQIRYLSDPREFLRVLRLFAPYPLRNRFTYLLIRSFEPSFEVTEDNPVTVPARYFTLTRTDHGE